MTLAETALPRSQETRALLIAAASIAILAAVWIFQGMGYAPCELCLTQRYAFYAAIPLALLTSLVAGRSAHGLARAGFALLALVFAASAVLAAYHAGSRVSLVGRPDRMHWRSRFPRRQRPGESAGFGESRALRRGPAAHRRAVACRLECHRQRRAGGLRGSRCAALEGEPRPRQDLAHVSRVPERIAPGLRPDGEPVRHAAHGDRLHRAVIGVEGVDDAIIAAR